MSLPVSHCLNADFDLSLRAHPSAHSNAGLVRQVEELSALALLGAKDGDLAQLRVGLAGPFLEHLRRCGLAVPRLLRYPAIAPQSSFSPFGWNAEAIELNRRHDRPAEHPALECVRRVNSRSFALELERELAPSGPLGTLVGSVRELREFLARAPAGSAWMLKGEHGNAGLANRRLPRAELSEADATFVEHRLAEDDRLLVEPWLTRLRDWCVVFDVPFERAAARIYEWIATGHGAPIGAIFEPGAPPDFDDAGTLLDTAASVASRLVAAGYFGPACLDALTWLDDGRPTLRPLVDLNCRHPVSHGVYRLWREQAPERTAYFRFFNRRKLRLPAGISDALAALGSRAYDRGPRSGILLATPLEIESDGGTRRPGKLGVLILADGRAATFELERWFRERFEV